MKKRSKKLSLIWTIGIFTSMPKNPVIPAKAGIHDFLAFCWAIGIVSAKATAPVSKSFFASFCSQKEVLLLG